MNATTDAPCPHGCPWPPRECCDRHDPPPAHAPLAIRGFAALGYLCLGASLILLARVAWHAAQALIGQP